MMHQPNCIKEASKACLNTCCVNPLPHNHTSPLSDPYRNFNSALLSSIQPNTYFTNHESLPSFQDTFSSLKTAFPSFMDTVLADHIRAQEYSHLSNHVCVDYIGHGLFSYAQLQGSIPSSQDAPFFDVVYNSVNLSSYLQDTGRESEFQGMIRKRIMKYMKVFEEDYTMVFTANQSSAFNLVAESYPFHTNQQLLTVYDYENESVRSMIESAKKQGARAESAVFSWPNFRVHSRKLRKGIVGKSKTRNKGLFVFPLQSRMTGSRYSYQWMSLARENGWHVLLDACALGAKDMETLGFSIFQPDFLTCSFFKIFGQNPSGFCSLFVKKSIIKHLNSSSTAMGIISITPEKNPFQNSAIDESFTSVTEIVEADREFYPHSWTREIEFRGLDHADKLGLILIGSRMRCLVNWLVNAFLTLRHPHTDNGLALVTIYGPRIMLDRGPAIAFNVFDWKGEKVDPNLVQKLADRNNISLTLGFLRNAWFSNELKRGIMENRRKGGGSETKKKRKKKWKDDWGIWVASISMGMLNNFEDAYRIWGFVARFLDADFVEKERWRYTGINQTTVEI